MRYCIHYSKNSHFNYYDEVQELEINFKKEDITLPSFLEKYSDKQIVINVQEPKDISRIILLYDKFRNIKLKIDVENKELLEKTRAAGLPFFAANFATCWDEFIGMLKLHPTDIYIVNELGFELDKIASIAHAQETQIRIFANAAQSAWDETEDLFKFFVRPEDIDTYSDYVDVVEFIGESNKLNIYYKIYAHDKKWFGNLNEIILDFHMDLDSRCIVPAFAYNRQKCGKRCVKGGKCNICKRVEHLAQTLVQEKLIINF